MDMRNAKATRGPGSFLLHTMLRLLYLIRPSVFVGSTVAARRLVNQIVPTWPPDCRSPYRYIDQPLGLIEPPIGQHLHAEWKLISGKLSLHGGDPHSERRSA